MVNHLLFFFRTALPILLLPVVPHRRIHALPCALHGVMAVVPFSVTAIQLWCEEKNLFTNSDIQGPICKPSPLRFRNIKLPKEKSFYISGHLDPLKTTHRPKVFSRWCLWPSPPILFEQRSVSHRFSPKKNKKSHRQGSPHFWALSCRWPLMSA